MEKRHEKPAWLSKLEAESWQAELLVSGIAIFGSLQLPGLVQRIVDFCLTNVSLEDMGLAYFVLMVLNLGVYMIIGGIMLHFILRAFWIGLVGFNSVFPGINLENDNFYSKDYLGRMAQLLPQDSNQFVRQLDNFCSTIFSFVLIGGLSFFALMFDVVIIYLVKLIIQYFFPELSMKYWLFIVGGIFYLFMIMMLIANSKKIRKNPRYNQFYYWMSISYQRLFFHIFLKPIQYFGLAIATNTNYNKYFKWILIGSLLVGGLTAVIVLPTSRIRYIVDIAFNSDELFLEDFDHGQALMVDHYENLRTHDGEKRIISAVLEGDVVDHTGLEVFIPIFNNEQELYEPCTNQWESPGEVERTVYLDTKRAFELSCYQSYHHLYIDDQRIDAPALTTYHPNQKEFGLQYYIPTDSLEIGMHILKVEKIDLANDQVFRRIRAPFLVR